MNLVEINELELLMGHLMLNEINITNIELDTLDIREGAINLNTINIEETSIQDINIPRVYINDEVDIGTASIKTVEISENMNLFGINLTKGKITILVLFGIFLFLIICPCQIFAGCLITYRYFHEGRSIDDKMGPTQFQL